MSDTSETIGLSVMLVSQKENTHAVFVIFPNGESVALTQPKTYQETLAAYFPLSVVFSLGHAYGVSRTINEEGKTEAREAVAKIEMGQQLESLWRSNFVEQFGLPAKNLCAEIYSKWQSR